MANDRNALQKHWDGLIRLPDREPTMHSRPTDAQQPLVNSVAYAIENLATIDAWDYQGQARAAIAAVGTHLIARAGTLYVSEYDECEAVDYEWDATTLREWIARELGVTE